MTVTSDLHVGSALVADAFLGATPVQAIYLGSDLVFERDSTPEPVFYVASSSNRIVPPVSVESVPGFAKCADGSLLAIWRRASVHGQDTTGALYASRSTDDGVTWSAAAVAIDTASQDDRDPTLTLLSDGRLVATWFTLPASGIYVAFSADHGATWGTPAAVPFTFSGTRGVCGPVLELANGDLLIAGYGGSAEPWSVRVMRSTDGGATWGSEVTALAGASGFQWAEPYLGTLLDGTTMMLVRNNANTTFYRSISTDDGATWSAAVACRAGGGGRPAWFTGPDGSVVTINRNGQVAGTATRHRYSVSYDDGVTWGPWSNIGAAATWLAVYAQPCEVADGLYGMVFALEGGPNAGVHYATMEAITGAGTIEWAENLDRQAAWPPVGNGLIYSNSGSLSTTSPVGGVGKHITHTTAAQAIALYGFPETGADANKPSRTFTFYFKIAALPGAENYIAGFGRAAVTDGNISAYLRLTPTGQIKAVFRTISTVYGTSAAGVIVAGQWHRIDVELLQSGSPLTGSCRVTVDNVEVIYNPAITLTPSAGSGLGAMWLYSHAGNVSFDWLMMSAGLNRPDFTP